MEKSEEARGVEGAIGRHLEADHERLDRLLTESVGADGTVDLERYERFRAGILKHIGIEEKLLMPSLRKAGGAQAELALVLREEHSAIASLLVGTPDAALVGELQSLFAQHNPREEGPGGMYAQAETLLGDGLEETLGRVLAFPEVPTMPFRDGPRVHRTAASALEMARHKRR